MAGCCRLTDNITDIQGSAPSHAAQRCLETRLDDEATTAAVRRIKSSDASVLPSLLVVEVRDLTVSSQGASCWESNGTKNLWSVIRPNKRLGRCTPFVLTTKILGGT
ncbi:unnamed protein product [Merluccius merluccius]